MTTLPRSGRITTPPRGFTLLELAVGLLVLGLLAGIAAWMPQMTQAGLSEKLQMRAEAAVQTFLLRNRRLPCADLNGDGYEDCAGPQRGAVAWNTIGVELAEVNTYPVALGYVVYSSLTAAETQWGGDAVNPQPYATLLRSIRNALQAPTPAEPYVAHTAADGSLSDCRFQGHNLAFALRTVTRPTPAEIPCVRPADNDIHSYRYQTLEELQTFLQGQQQGLP